jgi:hypothetical protein
MLVGLTNCKKDTENTSVTKYVGTVNGSFVAQDASIKVNKDLDPSLLVTRNWIMYAKNSPFYGNQPFALVKGKEFITGSAAQQWWSKDGNNPVSFAANQAVYSNLTPAEPVRLIMEGYGSDSPALAAYLGVLDFDPTATQFPLAVTSKSLGDKLIVNADGLTSKPGGSSISVSVSFQAASVDLQATETKSQLSSGPNEGLATGVTGSLDFSDIVYSTPQQYSSIPVGSGDCTVWSESAKKIQGTITITITFPPLSSAPGVPGSSVQLTTQAAGPGQFLKIVLSTPKLGWYDSATIGVNDQDISIKPIEISVDGQQNNQGGGDQGGGNNQGGQGNQGGQNPPIISDIILNASSAYQIYDGPTNAPEAALLGIFLAIDLTNGPQAYVYNMGGPYGKQLNNGEITDMGSINLITNNNLNGPPTTGFSMYMALTQGHSYIVRYRKVIDYQTSPLPLDYNYGIFYVSSYQPDGVTITYQGPFTN